MSSKGIGEIIISGIMNKMFSIYMVLKIQDLSGKYQKSCGSKIYFNLL